MGKERVLSFPVQGNSGTRFFPVYGRFLSKTGEKRGKTAKNGLKDLERGPRAVLPRSRFSNILRFRFDSRLKPVLPRFFPFFTPFFTCFSTVFFPFKARSCTAHTSNRNFFHLVHRHWSTADHHSFADVCARSYFVAANPWH